MLAGDLVFLSAAPDTLLGIAKYQWFWVGGSALAAGAMLAIAAVCSLLSFEFRSRRIMETDGEVLLQKYKENLDHRESWSNFAAWLAVLGTILMVGSVGWAVLAKLLK